MPLTDPPPSPARPAAGARPPRRLRRAVLLGLAALLLTAPALAGCGAGAGSSSETTEQLEPQDVGDIPASGGRGADGSDAARPDGGTGHDGGADDATGADQAPGAGADAPRASDRRVRRADVTLEVADLATGAARVRRLATDHGGYVTTEALGRLTVDTAGAPETSDVGPWPPIPPVGPGQARLVLRVPQDRLDEAVAALAAVGTEVGRWTSEQVVEADLVDLDARVATATRSVTRVRDLMGEAGSLDDVLALEVELARREGDLEALRARRDTLAGQAAQATLSVVLLTPESVAAGVGAGGFTAGLAAGWSALAAGAAVALTAMGAALPFAALAAVVVVPLLVRSRRRRAARPRAAAAAPSSGGDASA